MGCIDANDHSTASHDSFQAGALCILDHSWSRHTMFDANKNHCSEEVEDEL